MSVSGEDEKTFLMFSNKKGKKSLKELAFSDEISGKKLD
jgi:hypothetical protein